ncbi:glycoside hydrolase family 19 protein [Paraburkholderia caffeinilytica]|uniref:glycoside hydrolase family 19 protein n=1 Tax=Paraburkholderia caffeinilytica TaxID=1761016 RepID=UPI003D9FDA7B
MDRIQFMHAVAVAPESVDRWYEPVMMALAEFAINTPARQAAFLAQVGHESAGFTQLVESFNYRPEALAIFSRIPASMRTQLGRHPHERMVPLARQMTIANLAYGGRYGNRDETSGDGWRYRGRGLKQITFAENYRMCGAALGVDLLAHPEQLAQDEILAARSAAWFWSARGCNDLADRNDFPGTTRVVNGPAMAGHEHRLARWEIARKALLA